MAAASKNEASAGTRPQRMGAVRQIVNRAVQRRVPAPLRKHSKCFGEPQPGGPVILRKNARCPIESVVGTFGSKVSGSAHQGPCN